MALNELGRYIVYIQNQKKRQLLTAEGSNAVNTEVRTGISVDRWKVRTAEGWTGPYILDLWSG